MAWTPDREALAKKLYIDEGKSAAEAARILGGGATRNSIIGVAHRRGWLKVARQPAAKPTRAPTVPRSHVRPPKPGPQNRPAVVFGEMPSGIKTASGRVYHMKESAPLPKLASIESPNARPWMETRKPNECNWPIGGRYEIKSCCNPVHARGWCAGHYALGTVPTAPVRQRAAASYTRFDGVEKVKPEHGRFGKGVGPLTAQTMWDTGREAA